MTKIIPRILTGGSGTRLWPLSRKSYPKQFSNLVGNHSLFQQSALRRISSDLITFSSPVILTNSDFCFIIADQLQEVGVDPGHILIEPETKNTEPAILAASFYALKSDPDAVLLVVPSNHVILGEAEFYAVVNLGLSEAISGNIVTLGITPDRPETGYGYIELASIAHHNPVKSERIMVNAGATLSLQSHNHQSEHRTFVEGTIRVIVDDKIQLLSEGQSVFIPLGAVHRMENSGKVTMILIEVQTAAYLGEDDIIRYEDIYSRE